MTRAISRGHMRSQGSRWASRGCRSRARASPCQGRPGHGQGAGSPPRMYRGHALLAPRGPAHDQGSLLRAAPSPGKARLSRAPEECAEGAVWTGSTGSCGPSGPARAAWCAASLTPDSGVGEPPGNAAWSWCRGAAGAAWAPGSPCPPARERPGAAWEGGGQSGAVAPGSFSWGADAPSAVWKGPPGGSRPSSDVGGCL